MVDIVTVGGASSSALQRSMNLGRHSSLVNAWSARLQLQLPRPNQNCFDTHKAKHGLPWFFLNSTIAPAIWILGRACVIAQFHNRCFLSQRVRAWSFLYRRGLVKARDAIILYFCIRASSSSDTRKNRTHHFDKKNQPETHIDGHTHRQCRRTRQGTYILTRHRHAYVDRRNQIWLYGTRTKRVSADQV